MVRVFIADDHALVRRAVRALLAEQGGISVVGEAADGQEVLDAPGLARSDVLVLDLSLPTVGGLSVLRRLRVAWPHLAVVVHSSFPKDQYERWALAAGATAFVSKDAPPAALLAAIRSAAGV